MPSNFPGGLDSFSTKVDQVNTILAADVNNLQNAVLAIEQGGYSVQTIAYAGTITPDANLGAYVKVGTLTGNITISNPLNPASGKVLLLGFTQDTIGSRTVAWGAAFNTTWQPAPAPSAVSFTSFVYDGTRWQDFNGASIDQTGNQTVIGSLTVLGQFMRRLGYYSPAAFVDNPTQSFTPSTLRVSSTMQSTGTLGSGTRRSFLQRGRSQIITVPLVSITPQPALAEYINIGVLMTNLTINDVVAPSLGQVMTLAFTQDSKGGRTIAWGNTYRVNWVPGLAANVRNTITLVYDGTNWNQISVATDI